MPVLPDLFTALVEGERWRSPGLAVQLLLAPKHPERSACPRLLWAGSPRSEFITLSRVPCLLGRAGGKGATSSGGGAGGSCWVRVGNGLAVERSPVHSYGS